MSLRCSGCGLTLPEGKSECQELFDEITVRQVDNFPSYRLHRLNVDIYSLQHAEQYCASAKSFAAYLTGLCCAMEHGSHPAILKAQQRWLNGKPQILKPIVPVHRGSLTIGEVYKAITAGDFSSAVERWARSTWDAFSDLHLLARRWIQESLGDGWA